MLTISVRAAITRESFSYRVMGITSRGRLNLVCHLR